MMAHENRSLEQRLRDLQNQFHDFVFRLKMKFIQDRIEKLLLTVRHQQVEPRYDDDGLVSNEGESLFKEIPRYDEDGSLPDEEECLIVRRALGTLENSDLRTVIKEHFDERVRTKDVADRSFESVDVANLHLDDGESITEVALENLRSKDVGDKHSNEGAMVTNFAVKGADSKVFVITVESVLKVLVSKFKKSKTSEVGLLAKQRFIFGGKVDTTVDKERRDIPFDPGDLDWIQICNANMVDAVFNVSAPQPYFDPNDIIPSLRTNFFEDGEDDSSGFGSFETGGPMTMGC